MESAAADGMLGKPTKEEKSPLGALRRARTYNQRECSRLSFLDRAPDGAYDVEIVDYHREQKGKK
jgi:hypothetical protein